jgi:hypothetical protein
VTAGVMEAAHELACNSSMNEVLVKPLQIDKVLSAVKRGGKPFESGAQVQ